MSGVHGRWRILLGLGLAAASAGSCVGGVAATVPAGQDGGAKPRGDLGASRVDLAVGPADLAEPGPDLRDGPPELGPHPGDQGVSEPPRDTGHPHDLGQPEDPDLGLFCPGATPPDCSPGTGTGEGEQCRDGVSCYLRQVQAAIRATLRDHPDWFTPNEEVGCSTILEPDQFLDAVVALLQADGLCAQRDPNAPGEEITVKHDPRFAENFDIVSSHGCARYGDPIYTGYCAPAWW